MTHRPGMVSRSRHDVPPSSSRADSTVATTAKTIWNTAGSATRAIALPARTPSRIGTAQARRTLKSTVPLRAWARAETNAIGTIIASEVPIASGMATASASPISRNTSKKTGTLIAPPPTPKSPASRPIAAPAPVRAASSPISWAGSIVPSTSTTGGEAREARAVAPAETR